MGLPKLMLLKSNANNKFLCYGKEKGATHSSLRFSHELSTAPQRESETKTDFHFLKFEVEEAKTAKGFVHIRTCYNNKYWVRKGADKQTIVAEANEAEEDQSKWSCTLFKPIILGTADDDSGDYNLVPPMNGDKPKRIQLLHMSQLEQHYVDGSLEGRSSASDTFTAYDVVATASLPERLTLIGNDDRYISNFAYANLGFITTDVGSEGVAMWTYLGDVTPRYVPLRVRGSNKEWWLNPNNDVGLVDSGSTTLFGPIRVGNDHIALHVQANNNFLHRHYNGSYDGTGARIPTITEEAKLRVGEPVTSRQILSADYHLEDARVHDTTSVERYVDSRTNDTSVEQTGAFQVEYKSTQTMSWNRSATVHVGLALTWSVGIPEVGDAGLGINYDFTQTAEWGEQKTEEKTVTFTQNITIPPRKKVTLRVLAVKSLCDVPFYYTVRDVLTDGNTIEYTKIDGLFLGGNEFQFTTVIDEEDV